MHLTERERQVVERLLTGEKRTSIAGRLRISRFTVEFHLRNVRRKLGVGTVLECAIFFASHPAKLRS